MQSAATTATTLRPSSTVTTLRPATTQFDELGLGATGLDDIFGELDATAALGRTADAVRADTGPRMPKIEHLISYEWRPPPSRDDIRQTISGSCSRRFITAGKHAGAGSHFRTEGSLPPKVLNITQGHNIRNGVAERSMKNPYGPPGKNGKPGRETWSGITRCSAHSHPLPEPHDGMLHEQHAKWLKGHMQQRDKHMNAVYHALVKVDKAAEKEREIQAQREKTTDMLTRNALVKPKFSQGIKDKLKGAKTKIAISSKFQKMQGVDTLGDEEKKNKTLLLRAQSAPVLQFKTPTPRSRPSHLRSWKCTDRRQWWAQTDQCMKHTTPGRDQEEERELHSIPKYRARGA